MQRNKTRVQEGFAKGEEERQVQDAEQEQQREQEEGKRSRRLVAETNAHQRVRQIALVHAVERLHLPKRGEKRIRFPQLGELVG